MKNFIINLIHSFLVFALTCCQSTKKNSGWPVEYERVLSELTYPSTQWSGNLGSKPNKRDLDLLEKNKPQIFIGPKGRVPIDFYQDYVAHSRLKDSSGKVVLEQVTRENLKTYERSFGFYLDHEDSEPTCLGESCKIDNVPIYGRIYQEKILDDQQIQDRVNRSSERDVFILKYNLVFAASGLPENLGKFTGFLADLAGDPALWHELDIHGAIHIIIDKTTEKPLALVLAQHNHFRTYVFGEDIIKLDGQPLKICYAQRSNEPYLCEQLTRDYPTSGNPRDFPSIISGGDLGIFSGKDRVYGLSEGAVAIKTALQTLPEQDPFYVSWISLGEPKKLFGFIPNFNRNGPPGADINTFPQLKNYLDLAAFYYLDPTDQKGLDIYRSSNMDFFSADVRPVLSYNKKKFVRAIFENLGQ